MLTATADEIRARADALAARIGVMDGWRADLVSGSSAVGGGSAPGVELPTWLVAIEHHGLTADGLGERLRALAPPIIARIETDRRSWVGARCGESRRHPEKKERPKRYRRGRCQRDPGQAHHVHAGKLGRCELLDLAIAIAPQQNRAVAGAGPFHRAIG